MTQPHCAGYTGGGDPRADGDAPANRTPRRTVLRGAAAGGALGLTSVLADVPWAATDPAAAASAGDVLVVISLRGGFDGLSAIVPTADADYARLRPTVAVPTASLLAGDDRFGLHPALAPLHPFWRDGTFGAVHAVGQVAPTRSHFSAMAELERAAPGSAVRTGWLDRLLGVTPATTVFRATQVGATGLLGSLAGPQPELTVSSLDDFRLYAAWDATEQRRWTTALSAMHRTVPASVAAPARTALGAMATATRVRAGTATVANGAVYPDGELGRALHDVARLIRGGVGLRIACVDYGDWDFHQGMGTVDAGRMTDHLRELAAAMAAFATDLGPSLMQGVTVLTLSEFGRRVAENGTGGTDHGLGNAVLLLGGGVVGGRVHGTWPGLDAAALVDGDLAATTDYRLILREILRKRCQVGAVDTVLPGLRGSSLGVVRARS